MFKMTNVYMLDTSKCFKKCLNLCLEIANNVLLMTSFEAILCVWTVFGTSSQTVVTWCQIRRMSWSQRTNSYSAPKMLCKLATELLAILLQETVFSLHITEIFKNDARIWLPYSYKLCCVREDDGSDYSVALTAHHTPNLMSCNGTPFFSLELSADQIRSFMV